MQGGVGPKSAVCKDLSGQPCYMEQKARPPENGSFNELGCTQTNDRTSVNGNTRRSGDKSSIRNATARFKQFGHTVRMAEVRGMERFGHRDREGTTRKQAKVAVSQERVGGFIHSPLISSHPESKTPGSSVFWWN